MSATSETRAPGTPYRVNEIFLSVQAEGRNAGRSAVFVRFSGCNLACPFCDTNHEPAREMTGAEIEHEVARLDPSDGGAMVVFTGGEPALQLRADEELCAGRFRAMETNGILPPPPWMNWITVSPKTPLPDDTLRRASEIKVLYGHFQDRELYRIETAVAGFPPHLYLQPIADPATGAFDAAPALCYIARNPAWRLSVQFHKLLNIR